MEDNQTPNPTGAAQNQTPSANGAGASSAPSSQPIVNAVTPSVSPVVDTPSVDAAKPRDSLSGISQRRRSLTRRAILIAAGSFMVIAAATAGVLIFANKKVANTSNNPLDTFAANQLPLANLGITNSQSAIQQAQQLTINGQLKVNNGIIITPTSAPSNPVEGQIYVDKSNGTIYAYNNGKFVAQVNSTTVQQITQQNIGVSSIQGVKGDVSFTAGGGIAISGTTITNTGVRSLAAGPGLAISGTNGNLTVSETQSSDKVLLAPAAAQQDSSTNPSIFINKTGAGSFVQFAQGGSPVFTISNSGAITAGTIDFNQVTGKPTFVNSVGAMVGAITLGNGLAATGQAIINTGVLSLGGTNGAISLGAGLSVSAGTLSNSGVTSLNSSNNTVLVSTATGAINLTLPQDISSSASPSFVSITLTGPNGLGINSGGTGRKDTSILDKQILIGTGGSSYSLKTLTAGAGVSIDNTNPNAVTISTLATCTPGCANTTLNNIANVALPNGVDLLPAAAAVVNLGSSTNAFASLFLNSNASVGGNVLLTNTTSSAITPSGALTVGAAAQSLTLQGNTTALNGNSLTIKDGSAGNTTTLGFTSPTQANSITFPNASGTVAISASGNIALSGAGNITFTGTLPVANGGTGQSTAVTLDGSLLLGDAINNKFTVARPTSVSGKVVFGFSAGGLDLDVPTAGTCPTCASKALDNLASVAINTSLLPGAATIDLGSNSAPFRDLYVGGTAASNFHFTGSATAARTLTLEDKSGHIALVQTAGASVAQTGDINVSGQLIAGGAIQGASASITNNVTAANFIGPLFQTADTNSASTNSAAATFRSGNAAGTTSSSGNVVIASGTATNKSGDVSIDAGAGTTTNGAVNIGTTNAASTTVGRAGGALTLQGNGSSDIIVTSGGKTTTLGFTGFANNVTYNFDTAGVAAGAYTICTTAVLCPGYVNLQASTPGAQQTGNLNLSGTGIFGTNVVSGIFQTANTSAGSTNSANVTLQSGNATGLTSNSGNVVVDAGTATGTKGSVQIGTTNAAGITLGTSTTATITTIQSSAAVQGGVLTLGKAGPSGNNASIILQDSSDARTVTFAGPTAVATSSKTINVPDANGTLAVSAASPLSLSAAGQVSLTGTVGVANGGTGVATAPTSGQLLIGNAGGAYTPAGLTQGSGISITTGSGSITIAANVGCTACAANDLSNLAVATAVNSTLQPQTAGAVDLGATAKPFGNLYIGSAATNNIKITGTATAARTLTLPDATGTICLDVTVNNCGYVKLSPTSTQTGTINVSGNIASGAQVSGATLNTSSNGTIGGTLAVTGAVTGATFNGLTLTSNTTGFQISGGTTSKTLIVSNNSSINQNLTTTDSPSFAGLTLSTTPLGVGSGGTGVGSTPTDGQLLIGSTATGKYAVSTLTAGSGINIVNAGGSITVSAPNAGTCPTNVCADVALDNLSGVNINTSLTPNSANSVSLGSTAKPFQGLHLNDTQGTQGFLITGHNAGTEVTLTLPTLNGTISLVQSSGSSVAQTGELNIGGNIIATRLVSGLVGSADGTASNAVTLRSGNASAGNAGGVTIDSGTATGTTGAITIAGANASSLTLGRTGLQASLPGGLTTGGATINSANGALTLGSGNLTTTGTLTTGAINGQTISSAASFSGTVSIANTLSIQGANALALGVSGPSGTNGAIVFKNSAGINTVTLQAASTNPTSSINLSLPTTIPGVTSCLNIDNTGQIGWQGCSAGLGGSGTTNTIAMWNGGSLTNSLLTQPATNEVDLLGPTANNGILKIGTSATVGVNGATSAVTGQLILNDGTNPGHTVTLQPLTTESGNIKIELPTSSDIGAGCLSFIADGAGTGKITTGSCAAGGSGGNVTASGALQNFLVRGTNNGSAYTVAASIIQDNGTTVGINTTPNATATNVLTVGSSNAFIVTNAGAETNNGLTVSANGAAITGNSTIAGTLGVSGQTLNTQATNADGSATFNTTINKNDALTKTFNGVTIQPTINTGVSNTTTTVNALNVDTTNTSTTGVTAVNLLRLAYGGTQKLTVDSSGNLSGGTINGLTLTANATGFSAAGGTVSKTLTVTANSTIDQNLQTTASPTFNALTLSTALSPANGGTGVNAAPSADGQLLIGAAGGTYTRATITAGSGVTVTNGAGSITIAAPTAGTCPTCASKALDNLAAVAINTSLLPATAGSIDLGGTSIPFQNVYLAGSSLTPGTNNFKITGAATGGQKTITLPNASGTVCISTNNCNDVSLQASTPGVADTGNINVNGTIIAGTQLNTPGTLSVTGTSSFGSTLTVSAGGVAVTGASTFGTINGLTLSNAGTSQFSIAGGSPTSHTLTVQGDASLNQSLLTTSSPTFAGLTLSSALTAANGGTGLNAGPTANGQLLIGSSTGSYTLATLTAGTGVTITNGAGAITVAAPNAGQCPTCANQALSNLSAVAINTSLLPGTAGAIDVGGTALPFGSLYLAGSSVTPATNNFKITGAASGGQKTLTLDNLSGTVALVQTAGAATGQTGDISVTNNLIAGNAVQGLSGAITNALTAGNLVSNTHQSADTNAASTNSTGVTFRSGNAAGATSNSGNVAIASGTATGTSGNVSIDAGAGTSASGTVAIGGTNAASTTIGRQGAALSLQGNGSTQLTATSAGKTTTIGFTGFANNVTYNFDTTAVPAGTYTVCTTATTCSGYVALQASSPGTQQNGHINISGTLIAGTNVVSPVFQTSDTNSASANTAGLTIRSGNAAGVTSNSGNVVIDAGTATGTKGSISIGTANASAVAIGTASSTTTLNGGAVVQGGSLALGKAGPSGNTGSLVFQDAADVRTVTFQGPASVATSSKTINVPDASGTIVVSASSPFSVSAAGNLSLTGIVANANGGTGLDTSLAANGKLLIGNGAGFSLANLASSNSTITVTNSAGGIDLTTNVGCTACASNTLGNLAATTQVNSSLLPQTAGGVNLGSSNNPWGSLFIGGSVGNSFQFTGTATGARVLTLDDLAATTQHLVIAQNGTPAAQTGGINLTGSGTFGGNVQAATFNVQNTSTGSATLAQIVNNQSTYTGTLFDVQSNIAATTASRFNIAQNGTVNVTTGALKVNTINSFASNSLTLGATTDAVTVQSSTAGNVTFKIGSDQYAFPTGQGTFTICTTFGNCAGTGNGVTSPQANNHQNHLTRFTSADTSASPVIADSIIQDNGTYVGVNTAPVTGVRMTVQGSSNSNADAALNITQNNGTSTLYVRDDGRVGINISGTGASVGPEQTVDVNGTVQVRRLNDATVGTQQFNSNILQFQGSYWNGTAAQSLAIKLQNLTTNAGNYTLTFLNDGGTAIAGLDKNGNLGLGGVATPTSALDATGAVTVRGVATPASSTTGQGRIYFDSTLNRFRVSENGGAYKDLVQQGSVFLENGNTFGADAVLGTLDSFQLIFKTAATEVARFDTSGNFALGTQTPAAGYKFTLQGNASHSSTVSASTDVNNYNVTDSAASGATAVNALRVNLTGTATTGSNVIVGLAMPDVNRPDTHNTFTAFNVGANYDQVVKSTSTPQANAAEALFQLGSSFTGSANGTYFGVNPTAFTGNFQDFQVNGASEFKVTSAGAVTEAGALTVSAGGAAITGNSSVTGTLGVSSTLTVSGGGASVTGGLNNNNGGVTNTGSIAGATTITSNDTQTNSATGKVALSLTGAPAASATSSLIQIGTALNLGSANGTYIGINPASFSGNFMDLQVNGTSEFRVSSAGVATAIGGLNVGPSNQFQVDNAGNETTSGSITTTKTGAASLIASGAPAASATSSLVQLGSAISGGSASGTYIGLNAGTFSGNVMDLMANATHVLTVSGGGVATVSSGLTVSTLTGLTLGSAGNTISTSGGQLRYSGTAQNAKTIQLTAEYAGAALTNCATTGAGTCTAQGGGASDTNIGTLTSGFDATNLKNYYQWTSSQTSTQTYDIVVRIPLPSDFASWAAAPTLEYNSASGTTLAYQVLGGDGTNDLPSTANTMTSVTLTNGSWQTFTLPSLTAGKYSANGNQVMTVRLRVGSANSANIQLGTIKLQYNSNF